MAVRVNAETFATEVLQAEGLVLVDFYSDSCVPCKRIAPLLSEVAAADPDGLKVVYQPLHQIKHVLASKHWKLKVSSDESSS